MSRNGDLHGLLLTEKYEVKNTKLKTENNSLHQPQQRRVMSSLKNPHLCFCSVR